MTTTISNEAVSAAVNSPEGKRQVADLVETSARANEITRRSDDLYDQAVKEFGQAKLDKALGNFKVFDGLKVELAEALLDTPEAHQVLYEIGNSPDLIDRLYKMPVTKMIGEVARMGERAAAKKAANQKPSGDRREDAQGADDWHDPEQTEMKDWMNSRERYLKQKREGQRGGVRIY
jgi:hypothetical protein